MGRSNQKVPIDFTGGGVSIIEKAAGKLDQNKANNLVRPDLFEQAAERVEKAEVTTEIDQEKMRASSHSPSPVILDLARFGQLGGLTPDKKKKQIAEEFRMIKRPIITNAFNLGAGNIKNGNLIMVTSALAGEGKSFCAINLAMSIAMEMDHTVLLVDADVASPSIPKKLGFQAGKGLLDILLDDKLELADVMVRTNVEKLSILTAGTASPHATELLASQSMNRLLADIAQRYRERIVIFDSPPLLLTTESPVLATKMGQIVLVVEADATPQKAVLEALRHIESCEVVNLILNKFKYSTGAGYYGHY